MLQVKGVFPFLVEPDERVHTVRARTPTRIFSESRGGVALERPIWRAAAEPGGRRRIAAMDVHEVGV